MFRLIIAGSRTVWDEQFVHRTLDRLVNPSQIECVLCGMAEGPDLLGKRWADKHGIPVKEFPADWVGKGNAAGYIRNKEMADYATEQWDVGGWLIAFLDVTNDTNGSSGTNHMINIAKELDMYNHVVRCKCKLIEEIKNK